MVLSCLGLVTYQLTATAAGVCRCHRYDSVISLTYQLTATAPGVYLCHRYDSVTQNCYMSHVTC
jgi:hypothetical protein